MKINRIGILFLLLMPWIVVGAIIAFGVTVGAVDYSEGFTTSTQNNTGSSAVIVPSETP